MTFPSGGASIVRTLFQGVSAQDDAARRIAIRKVAETIHARYGPRWGNKKRTGLSDDFMSPDSVAYRNVDESVDVWDVQLSSGTIDVFDGKEPNYPRLPPSEATFMAAPPVDHLGTAPPPPSLPPPWPELLTRIVELEQRVAELDSRKVNKPLPPYEARLFGFRIVSHPIGE